MKKTIQEWLEDKECIILVKSKKKITKKEFYKLLKDGLILEDKYYMK